MGYKYKKACIFGGTGFVGRYIVQKLAEQGYQVLVASRVPQSAYFLKPMGNVGQIAPVFCDYSDESIHAAVRGCDVVVNCVGVLYETRKAKYTKIHKDVAGKIAKACKAEGVERFMHLSALGIDTNKSKYAKSKLAGERAIFKEFDAASIFRPSVVFGAEDQFFNMFAKLTKILPFLPLIGGGETKFQPVHVCDVAEAVVKAVTLEDAKGQIFELNGPETITFKQVYTKIFNSIGQSKPLIPLPFFVAKIQGFFLSLLPGKPLLTVDQVRSLKFDNVATGEYKKFSDLNMSPSSMDLIIEEYLSQYRDGGQFAKHGKAKAS